MNELIPSYSISKINLQLECEGNELRKKVIRAIEDYFFMSRNNSNNNPTRITLRFKNSNFPIKSLSASDELVSSPSLRVLRDGEFIYIIKGKSVFKIDIANSRGIGYLDSTFWEITPKLKQEFLLFSLLWLLRKHGLYALHANSIVKDECGILFLGSSGSGKSTIALSLIRQGWSYLSDDITLLRDNFDIIEAIAFKKGFSFYPHLANNFAELNKLLETSSSNGQKRFLDISSLYPDMALSSCSPKVLVFPKIVSQRKSQLIPIDRAKTLVLLIENSGGIMVDDVMVTKQVEILKRLVYQTDNYQLLAGQDLYEEPEKISEVISGIITKA